MIFITKDKIFLKYLKKIIIIVFWLFIWSLLSFVIKKTILLPSPSTVLLRLRELVFEIEFWETVINSMVKILFAYLLALILGTILGVLCSYSSYFFDFISPIMSIIKATPVPSITMLFLFYIKSKNLPVLISFLMVMPIFWQNTMTGFENVNKSLIEMSKLYNFSLKDRIIHIYFVKTLPYFFSAMEIGIGLAFKAGISSEIIAYPINTIGRMINDSKVYLDSPSLFAWTVVVIIITMMFELFFRAIIEKISIKLRIVKVNDNEIL